MPWVLIDILIGVLAVLVLVAVLVSGFLHVKQLLRTAKESGKRVSVVTAEIDALQRHGASHRTP